jgi:hypothetical protein
MPQKLKGWKEPWGGKMTREEEQTNKEAKEWKMKIQQGVYSDCMWRTWLMDGCGWEISSTFPLGFRRMFGLMQMLLGIGLRLYTRCMMSVRLGEEMASSPI